jgi:hypothetical protein
VIIMVRVAKAHYGTAVGFQLMPESWVTKTRWTLGHQVIVRANALKTIESWPNGIIRYHQPVIQKTNLRHRILNQA